MNHNQITDLKTIHDIIDLCYSECERTKTLHNDFSGFTVEQCCEDIINKLNELKDYHFYSITNNEELIGYIGLTKFFGVKNLYTFFVRPKFRTKDLLTKFWDIIENLLPRPFIAQVYASNIPASRFLKKNTNYSYIENNIRYFIYK